MKAGEIRPIPSLLRRTIVGNGPLKDTAFENILGKLRGASSTLPVSTKISRAVVIGGSITGDWIAVDLTTETLHVGIRRKDEELVYAIREDGDSHPLQIWRDVLRGKKLEGSNLQRAKEDILLAIEKAKLYPGTGGLACYCHDDGDPPYSPYSGIVFDRATIQQELNKLIDLILMNSFGKNVRVTPAEARKGFQAVRMGQGTQILRVPPESSIRNISLGGGASCDSPWAALRGAVIKFGIDRKEPVTVDGKGFCVPTAHTLMDYAGFEHTTDGNKERKIEPQEIDNIGLEKFYLVHASYCHPGEIFLPQGQFTKAIFRNDEDFTPEHETIPHMTFKDTRGCPPIENGILFLCETELTARHRSEMPFNILDLVGSTPSAIHIKLAEGGWLMLFKT